MYHKFYILFLFFFLSIYIIMSISIFHLIHYKLFWKIISLNSDDNLIYDSLTFLIFKLLIIWMYFSMVSNSNLIIHLPKISILTPLLFLSTHYLLINLLSLIHNLKFLLPINPNSQNYPFQITMTVTKHFP